MLQKDTLCKSAVKAIIRMRFSRKRRLGCPGVATEDNG